MGVDPHSISLLLKSSQLIQARAEDILVMGGGKLPPPLLSITCLNDNKEYLIVIYRIKSVKKVFFLLIFTIMVSGGKLFWNSPPFF